MVRNRKYYEALIKRLRITWSDSVGTKTARNLSNEQRTEAAAAIEQLLITLTELAAMSETNTNPEARDVIAQWLTDEYGGSNWNAADAIIAALAAEGMVIVPRDGSPSIFEALRVGVARGDRVKDVWAAALPTPTLPPAGDER